MSIIVYYLFDTKHREFPDAEFDAALAFALEQLRLSDAPDEDEEDEEEDAPLAFEPHYAPDGINVGMPVKGNESAVRAAYEEKGEVRIDSIAESADGRQGKVLGDNVRLVNSEKDEADQAAFERSAEEMGATLSRAYGTEVTLEPLVPPRKRR